MATERQRLVTVWVESGPWGTLGDLGIWRGRTGGNATSETSDYAPGGMAPRIQQDGEQTVEDVSVTRVWVPERDRPILAALFAARGQARMHVGDASLDRAKNPIGAPVTWTGLLGEVTYPDADAESSDPSVFTLVQRTEPEISA